MENETGEFECAKCGYEFAQECPRCNSGVEPGKPTPGPWEMVDDSCNTVCNKRGEPVADIWPKDECGTASERQANARLIAAAPEYDIAARLVAASAMPDMQGKVLISVEAFQATNAAIANATGLESP